MLRREATKMIAKKKVRNISIASIAVLAILFLFSSPSVYAAGASFGASPNTACTGTCIYVGDYTSGQLSVISASTDKVIATITLPAGSAAGTFGVTYVPSTKTIWVGDYGIGEILVFSTATNKLVHKISVTVPAFMALAPNGIMYVAQFGHTSYVAINTTSYKVGKTITACGAYPEFLAYNPVDGKIYAPGRVACYDIINPKTNAVTHVSLGTAPTGVAVNAKTGLVYITDSTTNQTYVVKGSKLVTTINSKEFHNGRLWGAFYSPATNEVYVVASGQAVGGVYPRGTIIPITATNKVLPAIKAGQGPDLGCYVSSTKDVVVTNTHGGTPGNVTLVSSSNKVVKTIVLAAKASGPYGCAVNA
jgi:YVTN family beta-propeller protein